MSNEIQDNLAMKLIGIFDFGMKGIILTNDQKIGNTENYLNCETQCAFNELKKCNRGLSTKFTVTRNTIPTQ
jgi:hypothetical protein